jgi:flagellar motor protein MotB
VSIPLIENADLLEAMQKYAMGASSKIGLQQFSQVVNYLNEKLLARQPAAPTGREAPKEREIAVAQQVLDAVSMCVGELQEELNQARAALKTSDGANKR